MLLGRPAAFRGWKELFMGTPRIYPVGAAVVALASCLAAPAWADIAIGSTSNFNDFDNGGWNNGQAPDPTVVVGGPGGLHDPYLRVTSDGSGAGGKLTVFNNSGDWTGMWLSAGVIRVEMDLRNFDAQGRTLSMRMGFQATFGPGQPGWCTNAFSLVADGQWHHAVFILSPQTMVSVGSPFDWQTAMESVAVVRLFHSSTPSATGTNIVSSVGIDNIVAMPAPGAACLLALGGAAGMGAGRRRK